MSTFFVRGLEPLVARNWSGSCMGTVGRALRTPGLDVKGEKVQVTFFPHQLHGHALRYSITQSTASHRK